MKSMLEGLDLSPKMAYYKDCDDGTVMLLSPEDAVKLEAFSPDAYTTPYVGNLRVALVAALGVISVLESACDRALIGYLKGAPSYKELETALEPFKVAGDDAKVAPK